MPISFVEFPHVHLSYMGSGCFWLSGNMCALLGALDDVVGNHDDADDPVDDDCICIIKSFVCYISLNVVCSPHESYLSSVHG